MNDSYMKGLPPKLSSWVRKGRTRRDAHWYREKIGGMWDEIGPLQFDFLVAQGLRPEHFLLDVGCGSFRAGLHFIRYLEDGHYAGVDADREVLDAGVRHEIAANGLDEKHPQIEEMSDFGFERLGRRFDFAIANSVFTHLPVNNIQRCLVNMDDALVEGGRFFATFFENEKGKRYLDPIDQPGSPDDIKTTFMDRDPFHYEIGLFEYLVDGLGLDLTYIGDWGHPRGQRMLCFTKRTI